MARKWRDVDGSRGGSANEHQLFAETNRGAAENGIPDNDGLGVEWEGRQIWRL